MILKTDKTSSSSEDKSMNRSIIASILTLQKIVDNIEAVSYSTRNALLCLQFDGLEEDLDRNIEELKTFPLLETPSDLIGRLDNLTMQLERSEASIAEDLSAIRAYIAG